MVLRLAPLVLAITVLGCGKPKPRATSTGESAVDQAVLLKLTSYTGCLKDHSTRVFQIADAYTQRFAVHPPAPGATVPLYASVDPEPCLETLAAAKLLPPALPTLEAAGDAFAKAVARVFELTTTGRAYFDPASKTYAPAKGIALHPALVAAFQAFDDAQGALFDEVGRVDLGIRRTQLARSEARDGRTIEVLLDLMYLRGEELVRLAATPAPARDLAALDAHITAYEDSLAECDAFALASPKETEAAVEHYDTVSRNARTYLAAAKQLAQRTRSGVPFSDAEQIMIAARNEAGVIGTPAALTVAYNQFVEVYYGR